MAEMTPEQKGKIFEEYVQKHIFKSTTYEAVHKTPPYTSNEEDFVRSSLDPDFIFSNWKTPREFWVEAKFRAKPREGKIIYWEENKQPQLERYRGRNKKMPVLLIIGTGEDVKKLSAIYLIPVQEIKNNCLYFEDAKKFEIKIGEVLSSEILNQRLANWKPEEEKSEKLSIQKPPSYGQTLIIAFIVLLLILIFSIKYCKNNSKTMEEIINHNQIENNQRQNVINHINSYVLVHENQYQIKTHFFSSPHGIENLQITVTNKSNYMIEIARVKITYLQDNSVVKTVYFDFTMLGPHGKKTNQIEDTRVGTNVNCELDGVKSTPLGLHLN
jgi:predicted Fe-S protein YdhL (DUF1289 family)